jgi:CheY-like chemotaxis protein
MSYRILLVEDEGLVRLTLAETLEDAGYHVTEAINGDEASALIGETNGFDVLLTDIQMPGRPDMLSRMGQLSPGEALLRKPFRAGEMLAALAALLPKVSTP